MSEAYDEIKKELGNFRSILKELTDQWEQGKLTEEEIEQLKTIMEESDEMITKAFDDAIEYKKKLEEK